MTVKERFAAITGHDAFRKAAPVICSMLSAAAFARFFGFSTANIFPLLFALVLIPLFREAMLPKEKKVRIAAVFCGVFFTLATFMFKYEWLTQQEKHAGRYAFVFAAGFLLFFTALSAVLFDRLRSVRLNTPGAEPPRKKRIAVFFGAAAVMFLCWLPYFLMLFPGDLTWDSIDELNQAVGNFELSNHHPIAHTVVIKFFYSIGKAVFEDDNRAVATYCVAQMLALAFSFSYLIVTMYRLRVKKLPIACVLACYALRRQNNGAPREIAVAPMLENHAPGSRPATIDERTRLLRTLEQSLVDIGYYKSEDPNTAIHRVQNILLRAQLHDDEYHLLMGMIREVSNYARLVASGKCPPRLCPRKSILTEP